MNAPSRLRPSLRYGYPWATIGLGPLLLAQGIYVRRTIHRLPEPEGARSGVEGKGHDIRVLIVGDSAAAGVGVEHQSKALSGRIVSALATDFRVAWSLVAQSGYTTPEIIERLHQTEAEPFDVAVISIGVNDVTRSTSAAQWIAWQQELHHLLGARFQVRQVLCSSVPPMHLFPSLPQPLRWYLGSRAQHFNDELVGYLRDKTHCNLIQTEITGPASTMASDGFHPGEPIYAVWAERLAQSILARWPQESATST